MKMKKDLMIKMNKETLWALKCLANLLVKRTKSRVLTKEYLKKVWAHQYKHLKEQMKVQKLE